MFVVFLPALNFRGNRSPYLWWFHKLLSALGREAAYICGDEYFRAPDELLADGRNEVSHELAKQLQYKLPDRTVLAEQLRVDVPLQVWERLEGRFPDDPLAAFKYFCLQEDLELCVAIAEAFDKILALGNRIEAVITCVNCATLQGLSGHRGIPVIHLELGPLRRPRFLQTAYFDFCGVNGRTEAYQRFFEDSENHSCFDHRTPIENLRSLFMFSPLADVPEADVELGLGLQVEDDSNVVCYANGYSALSLINNGRKILSEGGVKPPILVRPHPGSFFSLRTLPVGLEIDNSVTSVDFVVRCRRICSINSGVAVEGLLLGRAATVKGDCPFGFCVDSNTGECKEREFSFFLINYLVPWSLAFQVEYIRWRLGSPSEESIRQRHLEGFMQDKIRLLEIRVEELESLLSDRDDQLTQIKRSFAWRLIWPFRVASSLFRRVLRPTGVGHE